MPSLWTQLRAAVDPIVRPYNLYTAYTINSDEYVGTIDGGIEDVRQYLIDNGYEPQYLSAAKRHPETAQLHDLSYRRVPSEHPPEAYGKGIERFRPVQCQYHTHVFEVNGNSDRFSHYEVRPDFLKPDININRLNVHYRPSYGQTYLKGVTDITQNG